MVIVISPLKVVLTYIALSVAIWVFANPGYGAASGFAILLGGPAASLKLLSELMPDVFYEDLALGRQFSRETLFVGMGALVMWIVGGILLFLLTRSIRRVGYVFATAVLWIGASLYNIAFFALRSL